MATVIAAVADPTGRLVVLAAFGHALRFDADGHLVGLTIVGAKALLERDDHITVTIPAERIDVDATTLAPILAA